MTRGMLKTIFFVGAALAVAADTRLYFLARENQLEGFHVFFHFVAFATVAIAAAAFAWPDRKGP